MPASKPLCVGRFTVDLPAPFRGGFSQSDFNSVRLSISTLPSGTDAATAWQQHVTKLRTELGDSGGSSRVVKTYTLAERPAVFYRYSPASDSPYTLETWTDLHPAVLESEFDGDKSDLTAIEHLVVGVLTHFSPAAANVPVMDAFCLAGGAVHLRPDQGEQVAGSWQFGSNYEFEFRSSVVSVPGKVKIVEKARETAARSVATPGSHLNLVRAGDRTLLGMAGQESVVSFHNDPSPTEFYEAEFQFAGVADKGSKPELQLKLTARDAPGSKVSASDFNATWNAIMQSLRVRLRD